MIYLVPAEANASHTPLGKLCTKNTVSYSGQAKARDVVRAEGDSTLLIFGLPADELIVIARHAQSLLTELPTIVTGVGGLLYPAHWMSIAAPFPAIDFSELEQKLSKPGFSTFDPETHSKRHGEYPVSPETFVSAAKGMVSGHQLDSSPDDADDDLLTME